MAVNASATLIAAAIYKVGTYFTEVESSTGSKYVPRSVQIDLEAGVTNRVRPLNSFKYTAFPIYHSDSEWSVGPAVSSRHICNG